MGSDGGIVLKHGVNGLSDDSGIVCRHGWKMRRQGANHLRPLALRGC